MPKIASLKNRASLRSDVMRQGECVARTEEAYEELIASLRSAGDRTSLRSDEELKEEEVGRNLLTHESFPN